MASNGVSWFEHIMSTAAHLHAVTSLGVFDPEGNFHPAGEEINFSPLVEIFRERTLKMFLARGKINPQRVELLRSWRHSGFAVHSDRRVEAADRSGLESLLEYMERPAVSLDRLSSS